MLHWIAGKAPENPDATISFEPPETPAPIFAMRAFKHAIFGTPDTTQTKPRRASNTEVVRPRQQDTRPPRPAITRPKSTGEIAILGKDDEQVMLDPVASPTKGILMTPGTAAAKRKTVSFGDGIRNDEDKRPIKNGLEGDNRVKVPDVWTKAKDGDEEVDLDVPSGRGTTSSKLKEQLEMARDESAKRKKKHKHGGEDNGEDAPQEFSEPKSGAGKYWKAQYDVYRENTQREVKKLITKQRAAKSFAKEKDFACTELADQLRQEKKKVERLEMRMKDLEAQLQEAQAKLWPRQADEPQTTRPETIRSRLEPIGRRVATDRQTEDPLSQPARIKPAQELHQISHRAPDYLRNQKETANEVESAKPVRLSMKSEQRYDNIRPATNDDLWARPIDPSKLMQTDKHEEPPVSLNMGRAVTSGTGLTPLQALSVNTLPTQHMPRRDSGQPSPPAERTFRPNLVRQDTKPSTSPDRKLEAMPLSAPSQPLPTLSEACKLPETITITNSCAHTSATMSGPDHPKAMLAPPPSTFAKMKELDIAAQVPVVLGNTKENVSPGLAPVAKPMSEPSTKPSVAWTAINAPAVGHRRAKVVGKDGKEIEISRVEAARARINARGRVVS